MRKRKRRWWGEERRRSRGRALDVCRPGQQRGWTRECVSAAHTRRAGPAVGAQQAHRKHAEPSECLPMRAVANGQMLSPPNHPRPGLPLLGTHTARGDARRRPASDRALRHTPRLMFRRAGAAMSAAAAHPCPYARTCNCMMRLGISQNPRAKGCHLRAGQSITGFRVETSSHLDLTGVLPPHTN